MGTPIIDRSTKRVVAIQLASRARYHVSCACGFSTDVPEADSEEAAGRMIAQRHACPAPRFTTGAYVCGACGTGHRFCDLEWSERLQRLTCAGCFV